MSNFPMLPKSEVTFLNKLHEELRDNRNKAQIYRTETEMRYSVLNDAKFPTRASKYWQSVREMEVMYGELIRMSFKYRKNMVKLKKLQKEFEETNDELEKERLQVEIDEQLFIKEEGERVGRDRAREIEHWSRIKKELDDGSFDTTNVNTHQMDSLKKQLEVRESYLTPVSNEGEILNVKGPLRTMNKKLEESKNGATERN